MAPQKCPDCRSDVSSLALSCPKCGRPTSPNPAPARAVLSGPQGEGDWVEAGFGIRLGAWCLDLVIYIGAVSLVFSLYIAALGGDFFQSFMDIFSSAFNPDPDDGTVGETIGKAFGYLLNALYFTLFAASSWQATPGKKILGLRIMDESGERLGFLQSFWRSLCQILSFLVLGIGYLMIFFTEGKRGLHDFMAMTVVCRKAGPQPGPSGIPFLGIPHIRYDEKEE